MASKQQAEGRGYAKAAVAAPLGWAQRSAAPCFPTPAGMGEMERTQEAEEE